MSTAKMLLASENWRRARHNHHEISAARWAAHAMWYLRKGVRMEADVETRGHNEATDHELGDMQPGKQQR